MAITFDAASNSDGNTASGSPLVLTHNGHTIAADANYLAACVHMRGPDGITSVTWNGVALTQRVLAINAGSELNAFIYDLNSPATGNQSLVVTTDGTSSLYVAVTVISLKGVATSSHVDDTDTATASGTNVSLTGLTTVTDGAAVIDCLATNATGLPTMTAETNRIERANFLAEAQGRAVAASTLITKSPAGSVTMQWQLTDESALAAIAVKPAAEGGTPPRRVIPRAFGVRVIS